MRVGHGAFLIAGIAAPLSSRHLGEVTWRHLRVQVCHGIAHRYNGVTYLVCYLPTARSSVPAATSLSRCSQYSFTDPEWTERRVAIVYSVQIILTKKVNSLRSPINTIMSKLTIFLMSYARRFCLSFRTQLERVVRPRCC